MKITDFSIRRPVAISVLFALVVLVGLLSLSNLKLDLYPDINFPIVAVITSYPGAGPEEIETIVTRPLEEAIAAVPDIQTVSSQSSSGSSMVMAEANYGADMDYIALTMRERIDLVKSTFPDEVGTPIVFKFDPSMLPIMYVGVSGGKNLELTTRVVEKQVIPRLESIKGVASVSVNGGLVREFRVEVDPRRLLAYRLTLAQVEQALKSENLNLPGGTTQLGKTELYIRSIGQFKSVDDLKNLRLSLPQGGTVTLDEVARVVDGFQEQTTLSRINGQPGLMISIQKESGANTVLVARNIRKELASVKKDLGELFIYDMVFDQADYIEESIGNVASTGLIGALLAVLILWLFLRNIRSTMIIGIAIPVSIIVTFALIYFRNMTLNMISLGGLALGAGMLVDNSIVVLENIYRYRQEGYDRVTAAREGASEVAMAIIASTLTTMVVFLPVLFIEGLTAEIFRDMALTVIFSLGASLLVALTLIPMLSSKILARSKREKVREKTMEEKSGGYRLGRLEQIYRGLLDFALSHRKTVVFLAVLLLVSSVAPFLLGLKTEFMPSSMTGEIQVALKLPNGRLLAETDRICRIFEDYLRKRPEVETVTTTVGSSSLFDFSGGSTEVGNIRVNLKEEYRTKVSDIAEEIRKFSSALPDVETEVFATEGARMGSGSPIQYEISGPDLGTLKELAGKVEELIASVPGTREVKSSMEEGRPEVHLRIDRERANLFGLSGTVIASTIRTAYQGSVPTKMRLAGDEYDIRVILREEDRINIEDLRQLMILSPKGNLVPLSDVTDIQVEVGPVSISRKNQIRTATVEAALYRRDLGSVTNDIDKLLREELILPPQYKVSKAGQAMDMAESFADLAVALLAAILFVYMVMAIQYESLLHPFTILLSIPLMLFGITWSLYLTGRSLNVAGFIGVIMLAGIVVNNAIVLVDYIETLRTRGMERREAVMKAGPTRLRPVLMTSLTTILGMFPLALGIGSGAEMQAPLATVVIGGLTFSTLLTLVVIPVVYTLMDDFGLFLRRLFTGNKEVVTYHR